MNATTSSTNGRAPPGRRRHCLQDLVRWAQLTILTLKLRDPLALYRRAHQDVGARRSRRGEPSSVTPPRVSEARRRRNVQGIERLADLSDAVELGRQAAGGIVMSVTIRVSAPVEAPLASGRFLVRPGPARGRACRPTLGGTAAGVFSESEQSSHAVVDTNCTDDARRHTGSSSTRNERVRRSCRECSPVLAVDARCGLSSFCWRVGGLISVSASSATRSSGAAVARILIGGLLRQAYRTRPAPRGTAPRTH